MTKATLGLDRAEKDVVERRKEICRSCEHAMPCPGFPNKKCICKKCGCVLMLKVLVASDSCPIGKFGPAPAAKDQETEE